MDRRSNDPIPKPDSNPSRFRRRSLRDGNPPTNHGPLHDIKPLQPGPVLILPLPCSVPAASARQVSCRSFSRNKVHAQHASSGCVVGFNPTVGREPGRSAVAYREWRVFLVFPHLTIIQEICETLDGTIEQDTRMPDEEPGAKYSSMAAHRWDKLKKNVLSGLLKDPHHETT
jgi:hypothetical protein